MFKTEKASVSLRNVEKAIEMVKHFNVTVTRKDGYFWNACELAKIYDYCFYNINRFLFNDDDESYIGAYRKAAGNFKNYTKKELDKMKMAAYHEIKWQLQDYVRDINRGDILNADMI